MPTERKPDEWVFLGEDASRVDLIVNRGRAKCGRCGEPAEHQSESCACGAVFTHVVPMHLYKGAPARLYAIRPDLVYARVAQPWGRRVHPRTAPARGPNVIDQNDADRRVGGLVYFIQHETGGPIKIGISSEPDYRLKSINANAHDPRYRFLATEHGGRPRELELHTRFAHLRMHGEWFQPEYDLLYYIEWLPNA